MMNKRFRDERTRRIARSDILEYNVRSVEDGFTRRLSVTSPDTTLSRSELYAHSCNTRKECVVGSNVELSFRLAGNVAPPPTRGPHKIACGDFAGSPIRAFLPHSGRVQSS